MRVHPNNPSSNVLGGGITADQLSNAIAHSGYPLQSQVVDSVLAALQAEDLTAHVQEEWSYIDSDENQVRNLDALISAELHKRTPANSEEPKEPSEYLRFTLDLLIECKQSELPFVFFVRPTGSNRPTLGGMPHRTISVRTGHDDAEFLVEMSIDDALGTYDLPLSNPELTAIAMTRAHRRGKDLELSGDEAFRGLSLPLLKAESHYLAMAEPDPAASTSTFARLCLSQSSAPQSSRSAWIVASRASRRFPGSGCCVRSQERHLGGRTAARCADSMWSMSTTWRPT